MDKQAYLKRFKIGTLHEMLEDAYLKNSASETIVENIKKDFKNKSDKISKLVVNDMKKYVYNEKNIDYRHENLCQLEDKWSKKLFDKIGSVKNG